MSDPMDERLRSYYRSIQDEMPAGLETRVVRAMNESNAAGGSGGRPGGRLGWRPVLGLTAAAVVGFVVIVTLLTRSLMPAPSPSAVVGPSSTPIPSASASPTDEPSPTATSIATPTPTASPTASPTLGPTPTPTLVASGLHSTGAMSPALSRTTATRLADGRVLIAGGMAKPSGGSVAVKSALAETYDPAPGKFTPTGSMADERVYFTATPLKNGRVLVVGGADLMDGIDNLATAELYDPATGKFTPTGSMARGRANHTATLLSDGRVLIAGGYGGGTLPMAAAEIYNPATGKFTATGSMATARSGHTATLLPGGRVLVAGGQTDGEPNVVASAELYDPATGTFTATSSMATPRYDQTAVLLDSGQVLVAGGASGSGGSLKSAEIYNPATGAFTATGSMPAGGPALSVSMWDSRALVVVGSRLFLYEPASGKFSSAGTAAAQPHTLTALADGPVLLTEGGPAQIYRV